MQVATALQTAARSLQCCIFHRLFGQQDLKFQKGWRSNHRTVNLGGEPELSFHALPQNKHVLHQVLLPRVMSSPVVQFVTSATSPRSKPERAFSRLSWIQPPNQISKRSSPLLLQGVHRRAGITHSDCSSYTNTETVNYNFIAAGGTDPFSLPPLHDLSRKTAPSILNPRPPTRRI